MRLLITGGAGFIGSNLTRLAHGMGHDILIFDKLTYAGNHKSLSDLDGKKALILLKVISVTRQQYAVLSQHLSQMPLCI